MQKAWLRLKICWDNMKCMEGVDDVGSFLTIANQSKMHEAYLVSVGETPLYFLCGGEACIC